MGGDSHPYRARQISRAPRARGAPGPTRSVPLLVRVPPCGAGQIPRERRASAALGKSPALPAHVPRSPPPVPCHFSCASHRAALGKSPALPAHVPRSPPPVPCHSRARPTARRRPTSRAPRACAPLRRRPCEAVPLRVPSGWGAPVPLPEARPAARALQSAGYPANPLKNNIECRHFLCYTPTKWDAVSNISPSFSGNLLLSQSITRLPAVAQPCKENS